MFCLCILKIFCLFPELKFSSNFNLVAIFLCFQSSPLSSASRFLSQNKFLSFLSALNPIEHKKANKEQKNRHKQSNENSLQTEFLICFRSCLGMRKLKEIFWVNFPSAENFSICLFICAKHFHVFQFSRVHLLTQRILTLI